MYTMILIFFFFYRWYYEFGIGVPRDYQQAHHYYSKASKKGKHKEAQARVDLLQSMVKHQKNEKRRTVVPDKKKDAQCLIM